jgi:hypothetical protein
MLKFAQTMPGEIDISPGGLTGALLERMQDVHAFGELGDVEESMLHGCMEADLVNTSSTLAIGRQSSGSSPC